MSRVKPMAKREDDDRDERMEGLVNKEQQTWKRNAPFLYDLVITHSLEWPSLTVQWLPDSELPPRKDYSVQKLILGTHASEDWPNHLTIAEVKLPLDNSENHDKHGYLGGVVDSATGKVEPRVEVIQQIHHKGEINRARHMPQNPCLIATKAVSSEVYVFDYSKHPLKPPQGGHCSPNLRLRGHKKEGFGLSWSHLKDGLLLSGSDDALICLWDISANSNSNRTMDPKQTYGGHFEAVQDVAWHRMHDYLFGSVGDDRLLLIWDTRTSISEYPLGVSNVHPGAVNCLAFNPFHEWMLATSADRTIALYDVRKPRKSLHSLDSHTGEVFQIEWSPMHETILASCGADKRAMVWDVSKIGKEQSPEDAEDGPPELLFLHGGHTGKISDISWNPHKDWVISSVSEDNRVQIWEMAAAINN